MSLDRLKMVPRVRALCLGESKSLNMDLATRRDPSPTCDRQSTPSRALRRQPRRSCARAGRCQAQSLHRSCPDVFAPAGSLEMEWPRIPRTSTSSVSFVFAVGGCGHAPNTGDQRDDEPAQFHLPDLGRHDALVTAPVPGTYKLNCDCGKIETNVPLPTALANAMPFVGRLKTVRRPGYLGETS